LIELERTFILPLAPRWVRRSYLSKRLHTIPYTCGISPRRRYLQPRHRLLRSATWLLRAMPLLLRPTTAGATSERRSCGDVFSGDGRPSLGRVAMGDDHICHNLSAMAATQLQVMGHPLPWASGGATLVNKRWYHGHPALLPWSTGAATLVIWWCYLGRPALLPWASDGATLVDRRYYLRRSTVM
jgi:hypothetical protein